MKHFDQRVAVITGAASGFGKAFADMGAQLGMKLVLADIQGQSLDALVTEPGRAAGAGICMEDMERARSSQGARRGRRTSGKAIAREVAWVWSEGFGDRME